MILRCQTLNMPLSPPYPAPPLQKSLELSRGFHLATPRWLSMPHLLLNFPEEFTCLPQPGCLWPLPGTSALQGYLPASRNVPPAPFIDTAHVNANICQVPEVTGLPPCWSSPEGLPPTHLTPLHHPPELNLSYQLSFVVGGSMPRSGF